MKIEVVSISHRGLVRKKNEDNLFVNGKWLSKEHSKVGFFETHIIPRENAVYFGVYDGMGGEQYGEEASYVAAKAMQEWCMKHKQREVSDTVQFLGEYISFANRKVCDLKTQLKVNATGTTASVVGVGTKNVWICNIGDSPIFRFHNGILYKVYMEHTDREFLKKNNIHRKPCLTQYLGVEPDEMLLTPYIQEIDVEHDDIYLICSDGLTDFVSEQVIEQVIGSDGTLKNKAIRLLDEALNNGGKDNVSLVVLKL